LRIKAAVLANYQIATSDRSGSWTPFGSRGGRNLLGLSAECQLAEQSLVIDTGRFVRLAGRRRC
jgi:hypothetical protein